MDDDGWRFCAVCLRISQGFHAIMFIRSLAVAAALITSLPVHAHRYQLEQLLIDHPFARATVPGQTSGAAYLTIENKGNGTDRLMSASAPAAKSVEIHTMSMDGNVMRMRRVDSVEIKQGETVSMKPGAGHHLMMLGLRAPLKVGEKIPVTLTFEKAGKVDVSVAVEEANVPAKPAEHGGAHAHH